MTSLLLSIAGFGLACAFAGYLLGCHRVFGFYGVRPTLTECLARLRPNFGRCNL